MSVNLFAGVTETVQERRINAAGIYRNVRYDGLKWYAATIKDNKPVGAYFELKFTSFESENSKDANGKDIVVLSERLFAEMKFCPPCSAADIKYYSDKYGEDGKVERKLTAEEQIAQDWTNLGFTMAQLAQAMGYTLADIQRNLTPYIQVPELSPLVFERFAKGFDQLYNGEKHKDKRIEMKVLWNNNNTKKTSFLKLAKATGKNLVFCPKQPAGKSSLLDFSSYEKKSCMKAMYTGPSTPPASDNEIVEGRDSVPPSDFKENPFAPGAPLPGASVETAIGGLF